MRAPRWAVTTERCYEPDTRREVARVGSRRAAVHLSLSLAMKYERAVVGDRHGARGSYEVDDAHLGRLFTVVRV